MNQRIHAGFPDIRITIEVKRGIEKRMRQPSFRAAIPQKMAQRIHFCGRDVRVCAQIERGIKQGMRLPPLKSAGSNEMQQWANALGEIGIGRPVKIRIEKISKFASPARPQYA